MIEHWVKADVKSVQVVGEGWNFSEDEHGRYVYEGEGTAQVIWPSDPDPQPHTCGPGSKIVYDPKTNVVRIEER